MRTRTLFGRLVIALIALMLAAPAAQAQTQGEDSEYYFETDGGNVVLSNVRLAVWDAGHGDYVAMITVTPTQEEIDMLLEQGSHVDFEVSFLGLEQSDERDDFAAAVSDYIRQIGAEVVTSESGHPVYRALGLNIEKRWEAGEPFTVLAPIFGYEPSGDIRPRVSVELVSSTWWFAEGNCEVAYSRERNEVVEEFCTERGSTSTLVDTFGDTRFPF
jgi:hypothetical protein